MRIPSTTYGARPRRRGAGSRSAAAGERVRIVVSQPAAWKNEPYSTATLLPPMIDAPRRARSRGPRPGWRSRRRPAGRRRGRSRAGAGGRRARATTLRVANVRPAASTVWGSSARAGRIEDVLDVELGLGLPVHEGVGAARPARNSSTRSEDARLKSAAEPQPPGQPLLPVQQRGGFGEEVVGNARLVRAAAAEERPPIDQRARPPMRLQVRRPEPPGGAPADEHGVVDARPALRQVEDRLVGCPSGRR